MTAVRRVAIIGAECVGKTELARGLAASLPGLWIPEYLREFCDRLRRTPRPPEQAHILAEQRRRESYSAAPRRAVVAHAGSVEAAAKHVQTFVDVDGSWISAGITDQKDRGGKGSDASSDQM